MGIATDNAAHFEADLALLDWHIELGADEAIGEAPINRYETAALAPKAASAPAEVPPAGALPTAMQAVPLAAPVIPMGFDSTPIAAACASLEALLAALEAFEHCDLKHGARHTVFSDGHPDARVMVIGEAPGREEDRIGKPFVGPAGQMLDNMFGAIGLSRHEEAPNAALYIANVLPWRPPQNREPSPEEIAIMKPFLLRHIELAQPDFIVTMGNPSTKTLRNTALGVTKMRGQWGEVLGIPSIPVFHPAYLLRSPEKKREAWADLLSLKARLEGK